MRTERELIVEYGKKMITHNLTRGTGGNLSIYDSKLGLMAISPSGVDYFEMTPEDVVVMDLDGKIVEGDKKPSSEFELHCIFYKKRDDVFAVVHTHSTYATTFSCLNWDIPAVHYLIGFSGGSLVKCARYATFGTGELAENAFEAMGNRKAVLLANHGLIAVGLNLREAFNVAEEIEFCAEIYYRAKCLGEPIILPDEEMKVILEKFKGYGQRK